MTWLSEWWQHEVVDGYTGPLLLSFTAVGSPPASAWTYLAARAAVTAVLLVNFALVATAAPSR